MQCGLLYSPTGRWLRQNGNASTCTEHECNLSSCGIIPDQKNFVSTSGDFAVRKSIQVICMEPGRKYQPGL
ncbi:hypothetical protein CS542_01035 [Pedobacter sp. IW39]|nr:hypothetical protein CS542_01035 [Pedobacter sp. IW39]